MKKQLFNLKSLLLILATGLLSMSSFAQIQIGNSNFEAFDEIGNDKERPANWNNMKNGNLCGFCGFGSMQTSWRSLDIRPGSSGTYSVRIKSGNVGSTIVNGAITLGKLVAPSTSPADGYNMSDRGSTQFSEVMTDKPDSIVFWAKYSITASTDSARVSAVIHGDYNYRDPQDATSAPYKVARSIHNFQTGGAWLRMSFPFDYVGPSTDAQYIIISLTSSYTPGAGVTGATLFVDDLELIYNPNKVDVAPIADQFLVENQAGASLAANEVSNAASSVTSRQWKYSTTVGGPYTNIITGETAVNYTPQFATAGTYYVVCETDFDGDIVTSNEVKIVVNTFTIAIAPVAVQNLVENQAGSTLTVTESAVADSRVWKYSATSGGPYTTVISGQTGLAYTPQFATAGTYYVVCESTLLGNTETSNEVEINVTVSTSNLVSISPNNSQTLNENESGTLLSASETPAAANSREWKFSTTSGSAYTSFSTPETGVSYTPQFATVGTYYVVCTSDFGGGDIVTSNEVVIVVNPLAGIADNSISSFSVYAADQMLNVDFTQVDMENAAIKVLSSEGRVVVKHTLESNKMNSIQLLVPTGVYFYSISNENQFYQGKIFIK